MRTRNATRRSPSRPASTKAQVSKAQVSFVRSQLPCEVRDIDHDSRSATFVASTERAVQVGPWEPEVLRAKGCDLTRYRKNPVVLNSHKRDDLSCVIGRADVSIKGRQVISKITYAETEEGEKAWELVSKGFVRAVSVGYEIDPKSVVRLREGETDGEGEGQVMGPATVVNRWRLLETSNVPVPADEDAVRRSYLGSVAKEKKRMSDTANGNEDKGERSEDIATNHGGSGNEEAAVAGKGKKALKCKACGQSMPKRDDEEMDEADEGSEGSDDGRAEDDDDERAADGNEDEEEGDPPTSAPKKKAHEKAMQARAQRVQDAQYLRAMCPAGLERIVDQGLLGGLSVEKILGKLKKAQSERFKPLGTLEPQQTTGQRVPEQLPKELQDDETLVRALESPSE